MAERLPAQPTAPDFSTVFAKLDEKGNLTVLRLSRELAKQEETIAMISAAAEEIEGKAPVTYYA